MSIRNIIIEPDPILRKKSTTLETIDDSTRKLLDVSRINKLGWHAKIDLDKGIKKTISNLDLDSLLI